MKRSFCFTVLCIIKLQLSFAQDVTWSEDVACIIYSHCSPCHNSYNNPQMQFGNYLDVFNKRLTVELYMNTRRMPPNLADKHHSNIAGNNALTQQEIDIVRTWAVDLALEGNTSLLPPAPVFKKPVSTLINPDLTFRPNYTLPDTFDGHMRRCFRIPLGSHTGKNIKSIEVVPVAPYIVQSVFVYADNSAAPIFLDDADTGKGYSRFFGTGSNTSKPLYGWSLGSGPFHMPGNLRLGLEANEYLIIQVQYAKQGLGHMDSSLININFDTSSNIRSAVTQSLLNQDDNLLNGPFELAVDSSKVFHEMYNVFNSMSILSISPIAHFYCDNMNVYAILPNKDTVSLLKINNWDATWSEGNYFYQKPVHLPKGSVIHAFSLYSNTVSNRHGHNDTIGVLHAGEDGHDHDDKMVFNFTWLPYSAGDEEIVFDTIRHRSHHLKCEPVHRIFDLEENAISRFNIYPNPATQSVNISSAISGIYQIRLYNSHGQLCLKKTFDHTEETKLDVSSFVPGIYFIRLESDSHSETRQIMIMN